MLTGQAHKGPTDAMVKYYGKLYPGALYTEMRESAIVEGSSAGGMIPSRFVNHFYDPINYRGLTEFGLSGNPEEWIQDTKKPSLISASSCYRVHMIIEYNDKPFTSSTQIIYGSRNIRVCI